MKPIKFVANTHTNLYLARQQQKKTKAQKPNRKI